MLRCLVSFVLLGVLAVALPVAGAESLLVQTSSGIVRGYQDGTNVDKWRGIPYAAPPVGNLRFAVPQDPTPWSGVLNTTTPGPICPQAFIKSLNKWLGEEDCLYLDVYAPTSRSFSDPLPVLVWIYGGGWEFGDGIEFGLYDATNFVNAHNVIVVTFNYRLGPLGFMALPALKKENAAGSVGSYAIYDQQQALRWVQNNILAFGGDPTQVTIAGESAGAFSTCMQLASPLAKGLFRGAIMESGTCASEIFFVDEPRSFAWSENFVAHCGCDPSAPDQELLACIRGLDLNAVMGPDMNLSWSGYTPLMFPSMPWSATIDGVILEDVPIRVLAAGAGNQVPVIAGSNHDEGSLFAREMHEVVTGLSNPLAFGDMERIMNHFFGDNATVIALIDAAYPASNYPNATQQIAEVIRDFFFFCPASRALMAISSYQQPTYSYRFDYRGDWIEDASLGVYHSAELEFVFGNAWPPIVHQFTPRDSTMSSIFGYYWANFIQTGGNPNGAGAGGQQFPVWPMYNATSMQTLSLDIPPTVVDALLESRCEMWDEIVQWAPPLPNQRKHQPEIALE